jgi:hypothetical protein
MRGYTDTIVGGLIIGGNVSALINSLPRSYTQFCAKGSVTGGNVLPKRKVAQPVSKGNILGGTFFVSYFQTAVGGSVSGGVKPGLLKCKQVGIGGDIIGGNIIALRRETQFITSGAVFGGMLISLVVSKGHVIVGGVNIDKYIDVIYMRGGNKKIYPHLRC